MKKLAPYLLLIILFAGAAWYSFIKQPETAHETPPTHEPLAKLAVEHPPEVAQSIEQPTVIGEPEPEPEVEIIPEPLPLLNESDAEITAALTELASADLVAEYLVKSQAISRIVVMLDSLTSRQVPGQLNPVKTVDDKLVVETEGEIVTLSRQNYARYDAHVALLQNTDSKALLALYQRYYPLFQQAWEENGGEGRFNDRLTEVIDNLLETPDVPGPVYLTKPEAVYLYEDPELESMTAGQKILVRMGSANASIVKDKLAEIRAGLIL